MSLVAAFRCPRAVVICADTQETMSQTERVERQKIDLYGSQDGRRCAFAAAGNTVELIDALSQRIAAWWQRSAAIGVDDISGELHEELGRFYAAPAVCNHPSQDRIVVGVACFWAPGMERVEAFRIRSTVATPLVAPVMEGIDQVPVEPMVQRLASPPTTMSRAITVGILAFYRVKRRSLYVGFDTDVLVARPSHFELMPRPMVRMMEAHTSVIADLLHEDAAVVVADLYATNESAELAAGADWKQARAQTGNHARRDGLPAVGSAPANAGEWRHRSVTPLYREAPICLGNTAS